MPDSPERPAHTLLYEVALVRCRRFDERERLDERFVTLLLVMESDARKKSKSGALDELLAARAPPPHPAPRMRRLVEEMKAYSIAHGPVVEVLRPPVHLRRLQLRGLTDER